MLAKTCASSLFFSNFWDLASLKKLNTETRVCRTKVGMETIIFDIHVDKFFVVFFLIFVTMLLGIKLIHIEFH
ncbi:MAG: hypothetical protein AB2693_28020 [Candidatus Thiodiazotropha sp.]